MKKFKMGDIITCSLSVKVGCTAPFKFNAQKRKVESNKTIEEIMSAPDNTLTLEELGKKLSYNKNYEIH